MRIAFFEGFLGLFAVNAGSVAFEASCIVDIIDVQNSVNILLNYLKHLLENCKI